MLSGQAWVDQAKGKKMKLRVAVYNMEWMVNLFTREGEPKTTGEEGERSGRLAEVVRAVDPDILGIVEGPDTTVSGSKLASAQLEAWAALHGLPGFYRGVHGFPSGGRQELCALYKSDKVSLKHAPVRSQSKDPFNEPFLVDTTESLIQEQYEHYRPPFEISVRPASEGDELARIIIAHTKSKGIFDAVDMARFEQISERNRKKLFAECLSIRKRCDQWMEDHPNMHIIVMGDINDGFGMDYYEQRFRRSAIETLLGDVWFPDKILKPILPRPKLGKYGWTPSSSRFKDRLTGDRFNVLIDHILVSRSITVTNAMVWNPFLTQETDEMTAKVKNIKEVLLRASDHFPISAVLEL
jgi:endonuclease/exonuclease/phosphatase family metal-dependent hydrolase